VQVVLDSAQNMDNSDIQVYMSELGGV
jgi:hypothetical protein